MIDFIAYFAVKGLNRLFACIPVSATLWLGRRFGTVAFWVNRRRRLIAYANLKAAFAKEKSPRELKIITKRCYQNIVQTFMEVLNLTKVNKRYVDQYVEVVDLDRMRTAVAAGRGTILLTAHFGDWELSSLVSSVKGWPIMVLVREQKMQRLNELLNQLRESNGCRVIRKGMDVKNILRELRKNSIVGILADQDAGKNGMFVEFFGRPTSCHTGPMEIAKHTGALILPNFNVRSHGPYHRLYLEQYIDFREIAGPDDIRVSVQAYMRLLESYVRRYPDQWLWLHKRWKSTPVRTVLVLNDGKAGHLNQSLAVAEAIRRARTTQDRTLDETRIVVVDVHYRNAAARAALTAGAAVSGWRCHGCMRCMKACLAPETYRTLMETYAEFVVSCGSSLAPVNIFMSWENDARNIVIMKPNVPLSLGKFDLAVIPEHDAPPRRRNILRTLLAPNRIDAAKLAADGARVREEAKIQAGKAVALFVGGDNSAFSLTKEAAAACVDGLIRFCDRTGADLLVTTSRRTPPVVEALLKEKLSRYPRCRLLVVANEKNPAWAVGGMLDACSVAVVSGESVSMVSEAVSACRKTVVFRLPKKTERPTKHEAMLAGLEHKGFITVCDARDIDLAVTKAWNDPRPAKAPTDSERIFEAVRRLI